MSKLRFLVFAGVAALVAAVGSQALAQKTASASPEKVSYHKQIRPIFQAHCLGCHQPAKARGDYVMTAFDRLLDSKQVSDHLPLLFRSRL